MLYNFWTDKNIPDERKIRYTWEEVYESKKHSDDLSLPLEKRGSERYKKSVMQEIAKYSIQSEYIQTQYYVSFASRGRKFTTIEDLRRNNVFRGGVTANNAMEIRMEMNNSRDGETIDFVVAGFDPATDHDKAAFSVGILTIDKKSRDVIKVRIKNVHILSSLRLSRTIFSKPVYCWPVSAKNKCLSSSDISAISASNFTQSSTKPAFTFLA